MYRFAGNKKFYFYEQKVLECANLVNETNATSSGIVILGGKDNFVSF